MAAGTQALDSVVQPEGIEGVYVVATLDVDLEALPLSIGGRKVTAVGPHAVVDDLLYLTTEHPETLSFLPDPYIELE